MYYTSDGYIHSIKYIYYALLHDVYISNYVTQYVAYCIDKNQINSIEIGIKTDLYNTDTYTYVYII